MTIQRTRLIYTIADQAIGFRAADDKVLVAHRWAEFSADRHAFVLSTNDQITTQRAGIPSRVLDEFRRAAAMIGQYTAVTEARARDELERMGLPRHRRCAECDDRLPIGGLYCLSCGLNQTVPISDQPRRVAVS